MQHTLATDLKKSLENLVQLERNVCTDVHFLVADILLLRVSIIFSLFCLWSSRILLPF